MHVDLNILRNYLNHDEKMVQRFIHLFCDAVPEDLAKLKEYIAGGETEMLQITAHSIKSQCAYLGLEKCRKIALEIETGELNKGDMSMKMDELAEDIQSAIAELKMTLKSW